MNKYGVDEGKDGQKLEKLAADKCPKCGGEVTRHGSTLMCVNCGTEPFEDEKEIATWPRR
jgi:ribosomal protein S27AE